MKRKAAYFAFFLIFQIGASSLWLFCFRDLVTKDSLSNIRNGMSLSDLEVIFRRPPDNIKLFERNGSGPRDSVDCGWRIEWESRSGLLTVFFNEDFIVLGYYFDEEKKQKNFLEKGMSFLWPKG